jgi:hypothetical protein
MKKQELISRAMAKKINVVSGSRNHRPQQPAQAALAEAPNDLWAVLTRLVKAFTWSLFSRQKFTFFMRK